MNKFETRRKRFYLKGRRTRTYNESEECRIKGTIQTGSQPAEREPESVQGSTKCPTRVVQSGQALPTTADKEFKDGKGDDGDMDDHLMVIQVRHIRPSLSFRFISPGHPNASIFVLQT
ncbi:hypothetical protein RUM44_001947 [Polyplax serrata]|uniref:Uncharacterized protein n=1 Tax=Polyplax serrata TaxID=468196 RepID=A0ABR1ALH5_POLSC